MHEEPDDRESPSEDGGGWFDRSARARREVNDGGPDEGGRDAGGVSGGAEDAARRAGAPHSDGGAMTGATGAEPWWITAETLAATTAAHEASLVEAAAAAETLSRAESSVRPQRAAPAAGLSAAGLSGVGRATGGAEAAGPVGSSAGAGEGILARTLAFARRHRIALLAVVAALVYLGLGVGALALGGASSPELTDPVEAPATTTEAAPEPRALPVTAPTASRIRTCSVADRAADPRFGELQAQVRNAGTGEVLYDRGGSTASRTASALKVLTSAAALAVLGPDYRATTTVVKGAEPGSVVLVGGGDLTLSRTRTGNDTVYPGAAHLDVLAEQVLRAWSADPTNGPLRTVYLDADYFGGEGWHESWDEVERREGYMPIVTALQVDGDREDPFADTSARGTDPVMRAGLAFAGELGVGEVLAGSAPDGAVVLGVVESPSVAQLVDKALVVSDNTVAEMLARLVAIESGAGNDFAAINAGVLSGLATYGIPTDGVQLVDGSGLSDFNAVPPAYFTQLLVKVHQREGNLGILFDALPVSGQRGSLAYGDRFQGDNAVAAGAVHAKTGWIETGYTLAGVVYAQDGTPLTFAIYALGDVGDEAKQAIDTLTTGFFLCGDNLANR